MEKGYEQDYQEVLIEILRALKERIWKILLITSIFAIIGWSVSSFLISPKYEASINMIVNTRLDSGGSVTKDNISSAQNLVDIYAIIIKSNTILNKVIDELDLEASYEEIYEQVSVNAINNTQVMRIAVQNQNPDIAQAIVEKISVIAPDIVVDAVEAGSCKVISDLYMNKEPVYPNVRRNTLLTSILGFFVYTAMVILEILRNDYIVDDVDVQKKLGLSVLGVIPDVEGK